MELQEHSQDFSSASQRLLCYYSGEGSFVSSMVSVGPGR